MRVLAVVLALAWALLVPVTGQSEASDGAALCDIYDQQSAAVKAKLTNWCALQPCSATSGWAGVTCATVGGENRVVSLDASSKGLTE